jgi:hypothetical protein
MSDVKKDLPVGSKLTRAGWPRPIVDGHPVPWVSPSDELAKMDSARATACASGAICAVCGGDYDDNENAYVLVNSKDKPKDISTVGVLAMDNGILHKRCAQLALARCPKLRSLTSEGALKVVKTKGNSARAVVGEDGQVKAFLDSEECEIIGQEYFKGAV